MGSFTGGISSFGLGHLMSDDAASVKREVAALLGEKIGNSASVGGESGESGVAASGGVGDGYFGGGSTSVGISYYADSAEVGGGVSISQASVDVGHYALQFDKANSAITVTDKMTSETTTITGDPHVTENGQAFTFKNDTTFQLSDGTDFTIKTVPAGNGQTLSDEVDVSEGALAVTVSGLASTDAQPLALSEGLQGWQMRAANASDPTIYQRDGQWTTGDGVAVDQNYADQNL